jgi:hypothetical protein
MAVDVSSFVLVSAAPRRCRADVQQRRALDLLPCSAPSTRYGCGCALSAHASLFIISCRCQFCLFVIYVSALRLYGSDGLQLRASGLRLCSEPSTLYCSVCSDCTCTSRGPKISMTAPSSITAHLVGCVALMCSCIALRVSFDTWRPLLAVAVWVHSFHTNLVMAVDVSSFVCVSAAPRLCGSAVQLRRASGLLLWSAPATLCCCACAVTAHAPFVIICCR